MGREGTGWRHASGSSYEITFIYKGVRCRERIRIKPSAANDKKIERHRHAIMEAIENGSFDYSVTFPGSTKALTLSDRKGDALLVENYLESWLSSKLPTIKASTHRDYRKTIYNILIPAFGGYRLAELKRHHFRTWAAQLSCGNKRIANLLSPMRAALQDALDDEIIDVNPLADWRYRKQEAPKDEHVDPFNAQEQKAILDELSGQSRNLIAFAFWTGMRTSELVGLEWNDVDWHRSVVRVSRAVTQAAKQAETPKTAAGNREVKLLPPSLAALEAQRTYTFLAGDRIFQNPRTDLPWTGDQAIRKTLWTPALRRAKVRYRNPYQTRHTYASMMLSADEPLAWVSRQLGHSDVLTTARTYATWIRDAVPEAGSKAVALFAESGSNSDPVRDRKRGG